MNAIVLPHPQLGTHRPQPRLSTEVRSLREQALWITLHRDAATGLQNFTPDLVQEFRSLVEDLHDDRQRRPLPPYAVVQSADPDYFSMGGDLRFFRGCIQRGDAATLHESYRHCLDLMLSWNGKPKSPPPPATLVQALDRV